MSSQANTERKNIMHYFPITAPFMLLLLFLFLFILGLIEVGILSYAYEKVGIKRRYLFLVLLLSLLGSYVNIPVYQLPPEEMHSAGVVVFYGIPYVVPMVKEWPGTIIAINVGGAVVPAVLSLYLMLKNRLYVRSLLGVAIVAAVVHQMAHVVPGVGIAVSTWVPVAVTTVSALALSREIAPALAYITGTMGTLIGADLMNLGKLQGLGAPVASIGGAGTFDGIFTTGIVAVLLASLFTKKRRQAESPGNVSSSSVQEP
jgi:uncharacterized membrane protein